jgi:UDPglucose 6-dehydrogenase
MHVTILGAGYVGLVTGACLARMGHRVSLVEINPQRLEPLLVGKVPFHEPGLQEVLSEGLKGGALSATGDEAEAMRPADLVMVCVGTPLRHDGDADLSQVEEACAGIARCRTDVPVVVRSTLPLGSTPRLAEWLGRQDPASIVTNPEFLRQGTAVADFLSPTRIVIGTHDGAANPVSEAVTELYARLEAPLILTDFNSAEMIKNAANAFLATKLSFINEVADLCEAYGADVDAVVTGVGLDPRIGSTYLRPGIGFGGSCLPKELANMVRLGQRRGLAMPLMEGAARTNDERSTRIADRLEDEVGPLRDLRIALLGLAFKPDTDDTRYSPAIALAGTLLDRGARVRGHDPVVPQQRSAELLPDMERVDAPEEAVHGSDLVILATEWPEYRSMDWAGLAAVAGRAILYDGRNALDRDSIRAGGWRLLAVGHGRQEEAQAAGVE